MASDTVTIACKLRNGIMVNGLLVSGYFHEPGQPEPTNSFAGYKFTENFPKEAWQSWFQANKDAEVVTRKFIMAADNTEDLKGEIARALGSGARRTFGSTFIPGGGSYR